MRINVRITPSTQGDASASHHHKPNTVTSDRVGENFLRSQALLRPSCISLVGRLRMRHVLQQLSEGRHDLFLSLHHPSIYWERTWRCDEICLIMPTSIASLLCPDVYLAADAALGKYIGQPLASVGADRFCIHLQVTRKTSS